MIIQNIDHFSELNQTTVYNFLKYFTKDRRNRNGSIVPWLIFRTLLIKTGHSPESKERLTMCNNGIMVLTNCEHHL